LNIVNICSIIRAIKESDIEAICKVRCRPSGFLLSHRLAQDVVQYLWYSRESAARSETWWAAMKTTHHRFDHFINGQQHEPVFTHFSESLKGFFFPLV
jgi:hypothetical protein